MSLSVTILVEGQNVRERVISCIEACLRQIDTLASSGKYSFNIWYIDNSSVDGSFDAVCEAYPSVKVRKAAGKMSGYAALRQLWQEASETENSDFYLLIDPRLELQDGAITCLLENSSFLNHSAVIAGSVNDKNGEHILGGRIKKGKLLPPDEIIPIPCHTFDGNLLLVPQSAFKTIGLPNTKYKGLTIAWNYGLRAKKADVPRMIAPGILAKYPEDIEIIEKSPLSQVFIYDIKSSGIIFAIRHFFMTVIKNVIPNKKK
ncbi:MAG: hypothetical protein MJZ16_02660 [Bacteroidales bacterium]|nr:hypothetical protein [Bacteroidales bacterium]